MRIQTNKTLGLTAGLTSKEPLACPGGPLPQRPGPALVALHWLATRGRARRVSGQSWPRNPQPGPSLPSLPSFLPTGPAQTVLQAFTRTVSPLSASRFCLSTLWSFRAQVKSCFFEMLSLTHCETGRRASASAGERYPKRDIYSKEEKAQRGCKEW